jgi:hypothetical protein
MKKNVFIVITLLYISSLTIGQVTTIDRYSTVIKASHNFGLTNPVFDEGSPMTYNPSEISTKGAAFSLNYTNQEGTSFDGYPSGTIGGYKAGGVYYSGNVSTCGMPVQIQNLTDNLRMNWQTSQINANDADDRWWATINVIFDDGAKNSEPVANNRDYDLVIQNVSYLQDDFADFINPGGRYWYFARNVNGTIKPYTVYLNGVAYSWAVRYKFFDFPSGDSQEHKNDKVHIKFIPIDNSTPIPTLDHSLKQFIDCTKEYLSFLPLTNDELTLANNKVALDNLWIKSISAGYEIYEGTSTLRNDHFYTTIDNDAPSGIKSLVYSEQTDEITLTWDSSSDIAFDTYTVYRSENDGNYEVIAKDLRVNTFNDSNIDNDNYKYYVTAKDRSFNESLKSNIVIADKTLVTEKIENVRFKMYPNPAKFAIYFKFDNFIPNNGFIEVFDLKGSLVKKVKINGRLTKVDLENRIGLFIAKISTEKTIFFKKFVKH